MRLELVRDWMTRDLVTVTPDTPAIEAGRLMSENGVRRLPVVADGALLGIVTLGDIRGARAATASGLDLWELNYRLTQLPVSEIMSSDVLTARPDETVGEAAARMMDNKIGGLPVVDARGNLCGILTESDIFRLVVREWRQESGADAKPYARYDD